jgi:hypothetical protein
MPDSTTTSTPRRSPSVRASTTLSSLSDDFDAALVARQWRPQAEQSHHAL